MTATNWLDRLSAADLRRIFSNGACHPDDRPDGDDLLRPAAVLIPWLRIDEQWHILLTRRTEHLVHHSGQVAFPGGSIDHNDADAVQAALRELREEVGIQPDQVDVVGAMPLMRTVTGFLITPVLGVLKWPLDLTLDPHEVGRAFTVPLNWLADEGNYEERPYHRPNGRTEMVVFYSLYDGELIWGATARMITNMLTCLELAKENRTH